ncbi:MAG: ATP-binding cassette domain-containing protein [Bacillota bacterium]|nr:ATP-binding cassette domain-containing protein [Bacillota bacterium]
MPDIILRDLSKSFQTRIKKPGLGGSVSALLRPQYRAVSAVRGVSFEVDRGEILAFIGPNGAGKSTTIKMLTGILFPTSGQAEVLGLVPWIQRERLSFLIGSVFGQKSQLWYHLPAADSFDLLARIYELDNQAYRARRAELVDAFGIAPHLETPVRKLSLGERMRCEVAAALLHRPRVLFLDEPSIGLDVLAKRAIRDTLRRMSREESITVFLTSHDVGDIEELAKRVIVVNHGRVIYDDRVSRLRHDLLHTKILDLRIEGPSEVPELAGVTILKRSEVGVKLEVDTAVQATERVVAQLLGCNRVVDLSVTDPPLEQVIGQIYERGVPE